MNLSLANGWGIVRTIVDLCMKQPEGRYILVKDPNKVRSPLVDLCLTWMHVMLTARALRSLSFASMACLRTPSTARTSLRPVARKESSSRYELAQTRLWTPLIMMLHDDGKTEPLIWLMEQVSRGGGGHTWDGYLSSQSLRLFDLGRVHEEEAAGDTESCRMLVQCGWEIHGRSHA